MFDVKHRPDAQDPKLAPLTGSRCETPVVRTQHTFLGDRKRQKKSSSASHPPGACPRGGGPTFHCGSLDSPGVQLLSEVTSTASQWHSSPKKAPLERTAPWTCESPSIHWFQNSERRQVRAPSVTFLTRG